MKKVRVKARAVAGSEKFGEAGSGTPQVGMTVEVLSGEFAGNTMPWYGYFTEKSGERTLEALKIAGWKDDDDGWRAFEQKQLPGLGSAEFELTLEEEEEQDDNGQPAGSFWRATFINKIGVAMKKEMSDADMRGFAASIRQQFGGPRAAPQRTQRASGQAARNGAPPARQSTQAEQHQDDNDIPF